MKIHTFNTDREYTEHGQRIAWALLLREVGGGNIVAFVDADRGVSNVVRVDGCMLPDNLDVLNQYDKCAYLRNYFIPGEVELALREAALAHNSQAEPAPSKYSDVVSDGGMDPRNAPAPAQDERELPEVVAWLNKETQSVTTHPVQVMDWDDESEPVESLMTVAQHERIVAALSRPAQTEQQLAADLYEIGGKLLEIAHTKTKSVSTTLMAPRRDYTLKDARATALVMGERLVGMADRLGRAAPIAQTAPNSDCEWCAGAGKDHFGEKCEHCQTAPQPEQSGYLPLSLTELLQRYKRDLELRTFPDNDEGDYQLRWTAKEIERVNTALSRSSVSPNGGADTAQPCTFKR